MLRSLLADVFPCLLIIFHFYVIFIFCHDFRLFRALIIVFAAFHFAMPPLLSPMLMLRYYAASPSFSMLCCSRFRRRPFATTFAAFSLHTLRYACFTPAAVAAAIVFRATPLRQLRHLMLLC